MSRWEGPERRRYPFRRIGPGNAALFAIAVLAMGFFAAALQHNAREGRVDACERANTVRRESNHRIVSHEIDRANLLRLTHAITRTRRVEAEAFAAIRRNRIQTLGLVGNDPVLSSITPSERRIVVALKHLVDRYRTAAGLDGSIARSEQGVTFRPLAIIDCDKVA